MSGVAQTNCHIEMTRMRTSVRVFAMVLMLSTIGCDRVTKHLASTRLAGSSPHSYLSGTVRLEYAENPGAFLSLGENLPDWARIGLLTAAATLGLAAVAVAAFKFRRAATPFIGAMLFLAGGASNLVDRISRGSVVDFLNVGVGSLRTGIFNVADVALMIGVALMMLGWDRSHIGAHGNQT
jgi:signal peptidase II